MYAEAADFIANKNPKIFYIRGDAKYYRYEFNFVLCWLLQDMIGHEMRRHNNKTFRKASFYNSDNKLKVLKKKQILKGKEKKNSSTHSQSWSVLNENMEKEPLRFQENIPTSSKSETKVSPVRNQSSKIASVSKNLRNVYAPVKSRRKSNTNWANKENEASDLEEQTMAPSSAPIKLNTDWKERKTRGRKINYKRANDRGLDSYASLEL